MTKRKVSLMVSNQLISLASREMKVSKYAQSLLTVSNQLISLASREILTRITSH